MPQTTNDAIPSNRAARRDSLLLLAELRAEGSGRSLGTMRIRNVSATGLMAECDARLKEGDRVLFSLRGLGEVVAQVGWCREGRIGLIFDEAINPIATRRAPTTGNSTVAEPYKNIGEPQIARIPRTSR
ncbi:MAG: PilZ domain-containing protein [Sphingobium sp.]